MTSWTGIELFKWEDLNLGSDLLSVPSLFLMKLDYPKSSPVV